MAGKNAIIVCAIEARSSRPVLCEESWGDCSTAGMPSEYRFPGQHAGHAKISSAKHFLWSWPQRRLPKSNPLRLDGGLEFIGNFIRHKLAWFACHCPVALAEKLQWWSRTLNRYGRVSQIRLPLAGRGIIEILWRGTYAFKRCMLRPKQAVGKNANGTNRHGGFHEKHRLRSP